MFIVSTGARISIGARRTLTQRFPDISKYFRYIARASPEKFYIHGRDWSPGDFIPDIIPRTVKQSRRTTAVFYQHVFFNRSGVDFEFQTAHKFTLEESRDFTFIHSM